MEQRDRSTIVVVDGQPSARALLRQTLAVVPLDVREIETAEEALAAIRGNLPDLVLSEIRLPDASGFSLCRRLREASETTSLPVILMSEWKSEMDRILAFESGADDFVAKPYFERELASRVSALLRRGRIETPPGNGAGQRDARTPPPKRVRAVRVEDRDVELTPKELAILTSLAGAAGRVLTRDELIRDVWGEHHPPSHRSIDAHVKSLRRKLGVANGAVGTVRGVGYRFSADSRLDFD